MSPLPTGLVASSEASAEAVPVWLVRETEIDACRARWSETVNRWLDATGFKGEAGANALMPAADGGLAAVVGVVDDPASPFAAAKLASAVPMGLYRLHPDGSVGADVAALGWALERYRYRRGAEDEGPRLVVDPNSTATARALGLAEAATLGRDLVNTPANRLGPAELAERITAMGERFGAAVTTCVGDDLLAANYPAIHAVGRASARAPRLLDLRWGDPSAPKLTLVGKGVCFDTGGLDIKPASNMLLMKKDMGGAAVMTALAQAIMAAGLPVRLRLLVPAVENSISGDAFRPGDVIATRKGLEVEIGNTDAEGRLVLADALADADREAPDLLVDAATLTGAARVALGAELPALFTPDDELADAFTTAAAEARDPLWRLPLHPGYRRGLESPVADLNNTGEGGFAGAITAALFLERFVERSPRWAHLDIYGHNPKARPGRPKGGEATALLALWRLVERRYGD
ncbi:MAG: leucyl aminopeptidase family protein [Alphaproteobacteria bacterium]